MSPHDCFLTFHNEDKQSEDSLKNKDSQLKPRKQRRCILWSLHWENGVIYSRVFITPQAGVLPAKNFNELKSSVDK